MALLPPSHTVTGSGTSPGSSGTGYWPMSLETDCGPHRADNADSHFARSPQNVSCAIKDLQVDHAAEAAGFPGIRTIELIQATLQGLHQLVFDILVAQDVVWSHQALAGIMETSPSNALCGGGKVALLINITRVLASQNQSDRALNHRAGDGLGGLLFMDVLLVQKLFEDTILVDTGLVHPELLEQQTGLQVPECNTTKTRQRQRNLLTRAWMLIAALSFSFCPFLSSLACLALSRNSDLEL
ncbi:hypothetical protein INR49_006204 [Caranx melampygus]|nr:hypothetical protein INR49_006204 [Caranx melampygus]